MRLKENETVCDSLSTGSYDPAYTFSKNFLRSFRFQRFDLILYGGQVCSLEPIGLTILLYQSFREKHSRWVWWSLKETEID